MKLMIANALCAAIALCLVGCGTTKPVPVDQSLRPILTGVVTDSSGQPLPDVEIILYGGLATRWKTGSTRTDKNGQYTFDPCNRHGAMILDEENKRWDYFIGMTVVHPGFKSVDGKDWWDVRVPQIDRHVVKQDFVLQPEENSDSIAEQAN